MDDGFDPVLRSQCPPRLVSAVTDYERRAPRYRPVGRYAHP